MACFTVKPKHWWDKWKRSLNFHGMPTSFEKYSISLVLFGTTGWFKRQNGPNLEMHSSNERERPQWDTLLLRIWYQYLWNFAHLIYSASNRGFLMHICCLNKSIGRDDIGEKDISLDKNLYTSFPDLLTTVIRKKSLPNSQMWVVYKWCWHWQRLFTLPALLMTWLKLILEKSYKKKQNEKKKVLKSMK